MQTEVVLGIGGNKGDRAGFLQKTMEALSQHVTLIGYSQIYETEVWGGGSYRRKFFESSTAAAYPNGSDGAL